MLTYFGVLATMDFLLVVLTAQVVVMVRGESKEDLGSRHGSVVEGNGGIPLSLGGTIPPSLPRVTDLSPLPPMGPGPPPSSRDARLPHPPRDADPTVRDADPTAWDADPTARDADPTARDADSTARDVDSTARDADPNARDAVGTTAKDAAGTTARDAGLPPGDVYSTPKDAAISANDAGSPAKDSGSPTNDAAPPLKDTGSPAKDVGVSANDADPLFEDAGSPSKDAGPPLIDSGSAKDADPPLKDAVLPANDAAPPLKDASFPANDAAPPATDGAERAILWWTPFTGVGHGQSRFCHMGSCFFTEDRGAYLHHPSTEAVLFYGSDFSVEDLPLPRRSPHQWWALLHEESPKNQPLFDHQLVLELFNLTATFRRKSNFPLTLQHLDSLESLVSRSEFVPTTVKNQLMAEEDLSPVVYVQSDCDTPSERDNYVQQLSKYIKIDSYGSCLHNRDLPPHLHDPADTFNHVDFRAIVAKYKFTLAIENAACDDYITEKLWRPLTLGSVPIYWGSPSVRTWEPNPRSVILVSEFESPQQLAAHLYKLMENETLYESHLKHKVEQKIGNLNLTHAMAHRKWGINNDFDKGNFIEHFECFVCDKVLSRHSKVEQLGGEVMASLDHYGCPEPPNVLTGKPNRKSFWVEQWHKARMEAKVLSRLVKTNKKFYPDQFYQEVIDELQKDGFFFKFPPEHVEL